MAAQPALSDLTLVPGMRAAAFGWLEHATPNAYTLSIVPAWDPDRSCRYAEGLVPVSPREWVAKLPDGTVNVTGTWTGTSLVDACFSPARRPLIDTWQGQAGHLAMSALGMKRYSQLSEHIVAASAAPVLSIAGFDDGVMMLVLYVTQSLVDAQRELPVRLDIYPAIAPLP